MNLAEICGCENCDKKTVCKYAFGFKANVASLPLGAEEMLNISCKDFFPTVVPKIVTAIEGGYDIEMSDGTHKIINLENVVKSIDLTGEFEQNEQR